MAQTAEKAKGIDMGAVDFVSKPFDSVELLARVNSALRTKALLDLLEQRAHLDGLTELGNRFALRDALPLQLTVSRQRNEPLAVVIADLDHFKRINDQFGHAAGDEVLRRLAMVFRREVSAGDFLARYGGEEFVALCPNRGLTSALDLAERIRQSISDEKIVFRNQAIKMTTSIGVAIISSGETPEPADLLDRADQALYRAKAAGRNAVWFFDHESQRPFPAALARALLDPSAPRPGDHSLALPPSPTPARESARPPEAPPSPSPSRESGPAAVAVEDPYRTIAMSASGPCPKED
jgi:diguanylate cyclase (GGDEF)-like protein